MATNQPAAADHSAFCTNAGMALRLEQTLAWLAQRPAWLFLAWSFWLSAEYLVFGPASYVRVHDNGDATLPMLLANCPPQGLPWNALGLCGLDGWAWGVQLTSVFFWALPGWLAYGSFMFLQRFLAGYFMHRLLKDTLNLSLLPGVFAGLLYAQFSQPSNNASWAGFTLYDTLGLPGLPLLIWALYRLAARPGWLWLPGGLLLGMVFGLGSPYAFAPFIMMAVCGWVMIQRPASLPRFVVLLGLLVVGCAIVNLPTVWAGSMNAPLSHRAAWEVNPADVRSLWENIQFGSSFALDNLLPLGLAVLGYALVKTRCRRLLTLALLIGFSVMFIICYEPLMGALKGHLGFLAGFQFSRVYLIIPFLAIVAGALGLENISREWKFSTSQNGKARWSANLSVALFIVAGALIVGKSVSIKARTLSELAGGANFGSLYQNPQLAALAAKLKAEAPGRVATVFSPNDPLLHPGFAWAYGLETVDGYANLYPKRYQNYWEAVIAPLTGADKNRHDYFHYWGNRVYLFAPSGGFPKADVTFADYYRLELLSLANVRYVISARPLTDARLKLLPHAAREDQLKWAAQSKTRNRYRCCGENPNVPLYVYENTGAGPRYFLAGHVKGFENRADVLKHFGAATAEELQSTVFLNKPEAQLPQLGGATLENSTVKVVSQSSCAFNSA
ncbi:MAG: DUF6044 family protein [Verrucomicrobiota bacterium]